MKDHDIIYSIRRVSVVLTCFAMIADPTTSNTRAWMTNCIYSMMVCVRTACARLPNDGIFNTTTVIILALFAMVALQIRRVATYWPACCSFNGLHRYTLGQLELCTVTIISRKLLTLHSFISVQLLALRAVYCHCKLLPHQRAKAGFHKFLGMVGCGQESRRI